MAKKPGIWETIKSGSNKEFVSYLKKTLKDHLFSLCLMIFGLIFLFVGEKFPQSEFILIIIGLISVLVGSGHLIYSVIIEHFNYKKVK